jgi:type I restriction enzyme S subunit
MSFDFPLGRTIYPVHTIAEGAQFISGYAFKSKDFIESGYPVIKIKNIQNGKVTIADSQFVSPDTVEGLERFKLSDGDILIAMTGQGSVGRVGRLSCKKGSEPYLNQRVGKFLADEKRLNIDYLYYVLSTKKYQEILFLSGSGSGQPNLSPATIKSVEIPYAPYEIQCQIAATFNAIDGKVSSNIEINHTLDQIAQALFKSWFVDFEPVKAKILVLEAGGTQEEATLAAMTAISGKDVDSLIVFEQEHPEQYAELKATAELFPSTMQESELGDIPERWELGKLQDLLVLQRGFDLPASSRTDGEYPLIAASGPSGTHNKAMAKAPGVVTGRSGLLGKVFLVLEDFWPLNTTLWIKEFKRATPCFAYELLRLLDLKAFNAGSAVPSLNRNHVHSLCYPLPPMNLVKAFESIVSFLHQRALNNTKQSQTLATLRDTLLPKLLSGEISLPEAEQAVSEAENV